LTKARKTLQKEKHERFKQHTGVPNPKRKGGEGGPRQHRWKVIT